MTRLDLPHRNVTLGYDTMGEGPAVLLLHPFPFDRRFWDGLSLPGFRVVRVDARGFGESSLLGDVTIDQLADDALHLLDDLGIPMAAVVGSSMGGYVALSLAARHPQRLSALVLVGTRAGADGDAARANRDAGARQIRDHGVASWLAGIGTRLCARGAHEIARVEALAGSSAPDPARALPALLLAMKERPDRTFALSTLHVPTLVVVGTEDAVTPPDEARAMKRAIAGATLVEMAGAGHLPSAEVAADFQRVLADFLEATLAAP